MIIQQDEIMKKSIIIPIILLSLFFLWPSIARAATNLSFDLDHHSVAVGRDFIVDIIAQSNDTTFYSADFEISFDRAVISLTTVDTSAGSLLDCATGEVWRSDPYNLDTGTIMAQAFRHDCAPLAVNSATILARLKFTALSVGAATIKVEQVDYRSSSGVNETNINKPSVTVSVIASDTVSPSLSINPITANPTKISPITITGSVADDVEVAQVTWSNNRGGNGQAAVNTGAGSWTLDAPLTAGDNIISVTAADTSHNTALKTITITYAPAQAAVSLNPSSQNVKAGDTFSVSLRVNDVAAMDNLTADLLFDSSKISYDHAAISNNIAGLNWTADVFDCATPAPGCKNILVKSNFVNLLNGSADLITLYFVAKVVGTNSFTYANNHVYDGSFNETTASWNSAVAIIALASVTSNNCTSFTYSSYSSCQSSGTQSRTILTRSPLNCVGGTPEPLSRSCVYTPPVTSGGGDGGGGGGGAAEGTAPTPNNPNNIGVSSSVSCLQLELGEWQTTCVNGWQYRDIKSKNPLGCGLTVAQISNAKRGCVATAAPTAPAKTVVDPAASAGAARQVQNILAEAAIIFSGKIENILAAVGAARNGQAEAGVSVKYTAPLVSGLKNITAEVKLTATNFINYGTPTTKFLGVGERAGVLSSYRAAFGKVPKTEAEWQDVIKIANGRWPSEKSPAAEAKAKASFKKIYGREANMSKANDNAAVTIMAYGLRPVLRNLKSEKTAILSFKYFIKRAPTSATDWDMVRTIAYSGAKR